MQAVFALGMHGPGGGYLPAALDKGHRQRVPGLGLLVGEHHHHHPVIGKQTMQAAEGGPHLALIIAASQLASALLALKQRHICHRLLLLVSHSGAVKVRKYLPQKPLLPHIEKVRALGIHHVVIVRRVHHDDIHRAVGRVAIGRRIALCHLYLRRLLSKIPIWCRQRRKLLVGIQYLICPPWPCPHLREYWLHLREAPLEGEIVAIKGTLDRTPCALPAGHPSVVVHPFSEYHGQICHHCLPSVFLEGLTKLSAHLFYRPGIDQMAEQLAGGEHIAP